ncbi:MAG: ferrous iron transport protein A [Polaromonas sp.]|nr:ferrous iron transport protein A [Polaromonas sp.]
MDFGITLADAPLREAFTVREVVATGSAPEWPSQLADIGFLPGERVAVLARGLPGNDPLVVRIGLSTFALRTKEAACVLVDPIITGAAAKTCV